MPDVTLPVFKGPLDLLLHLIERDDLDITTVSLLAVTDQYMSRIRGEEGLDPRALADFVAIGARLLYLKSRALLPRPVVHAIEPDDEDDSVGQELVDLLVEYRRFTAITDMLEGRQDAGIRVYSRIAAPPTLPERSGLDGVTIQRLRGIMEDMLKRVPAVPRAIIPRDTVTLSSRLTEFRLRLRSRGGFSFRDAIASCESRLQVVVSFMAVLELLKAGECDVRQADAWGDIEIFSLVAA